MVAILKKKRETVPGRSLFVDVSSQVAASFYLCLQIFCWVVLEFNPILTPNLQILQIMISLKVCSLFENVW